MKIGPKFMKPVRLVSCLIGVSVLLASCEDGRRAHSDRGTGRTLSPVLDIHTTPVTDLDVLFVRDNSGSRGE